MHTSSKALGAALLALSCAGAQAGVLNFQGVTFTTSYSGNVLQLEIDAAHPTGNWSNAVALGGLGIKDVGTFSTVQLLQAPGTASGWSFSTREISANGCLHGGNASKTVCYQGSLLPLADDLIFRFAFVGGVQALSSPHLKVNFFNAAGNQIGSLMSLNVPLAEDPPADVPEPGTLMLMTGALAAAGLARRRRR